MKEVTLPRAGARLLAAGALGEMAVGAIVAAFPSVVDVLIDTPLDAGGRLVARMLGVALLAVGLSWWLARGDAARAARQAPGFIVYNLGIGALFALAALAAAHPLLPAIVAVVHVAAGALLAAVVATASAQAARTPR